MSAAASVLSGDEKEILFVYADEKIPDDYKETLQNYNCNASLLPLAFACILSKDKKDDSLELDTDTLADTPLEFLKTTL